MPYCDCFPLQLWKKLLADINDTATGVPEQEYITRFKNNVYCETQKIFTCRS